MHTDQTNEDASKPIRESSTSNELQMKVIAEGVRRIENIITGQTAGLTENQFREALG